jgi:FixJ family two-component response regulator
MTSNTASLIYIVDDDASILKAYRRLLESEGFAVKTFLSAMDYLAHVVKGRLNKQIADDLRIAEKTVKIHRGRMMHKIGVRSVAELVRFAAQIGDTEIAET